MSEKPVESFGVFRMDKVKKSAGGKLLRLIRHFLRLDIADNVDKTRVEKDSFIGASTPKEIYDAIRGRWALVDGLRSDAVGVLDCLATTTNGLPKGEEEEWLADVIAELKSFYGEENFIGAYIHRDEKEVHVHSLIVPLETKEVEKTRLTAAEQEQLKAALEADGKKFLAVPKKPDKEEKNEKVWKKYKKDVKAYDAFKKDIKPYMKKLGFVRTENKLNAQKYCGGRAVLSATQDMWWEHVSKKYGLGRGEKNSGKVYQGPTSLYKWAQKLKIREEELKEQEAKLKQDKKNKTKDVEAELKALQDEINKLNAEKTRLLSQKKSYNEAIAANKKDYESKLAEAKTNAENAAAKKYETQLSELRKTAALVPGLQNELATKTKQLDFWTKCSPDELRERAANRARNAAMGIGQGRSNN